jgi:hypothetical protein
MGSAAAKKRPMRSRRSGVKKLELVKANLTVLKKYALLLIIVLLAGCVPVREVRFTRQHNYYQRHREHTFTAPVWIPGRGVILHTQRVRIPQRAKVPQRPFPSRPSRKH